MANKPKIPLYHDISEQLRPLTRNDILDTPWLHPPNLETITCICECGIEKSLRWDGMFPSEAYHNVSGVENSPGKYTPVRTLYATCECGKRLSVPIPDSNKESGFLHFYGDESSIKYKSNQNFIYIYAFVAFSISGHEYYGRKMYDVKRKLLPKKDPNSWVFHAQEIRSEYGRKKIGITLSAPEINDIFKDLLASLKLTSSEVPDRAWNFICVTHTCAKINPNQKYSEHIVRDHTLINAIYALTYFMANEGYSLDFSLESQDTSYKNNMLDYFVERVGRSCRYHPIYIYICRQKYVGLPKTIRKGAALELEYADFVAWIVRSYFNCIRLGRSAHFNLNDLGPVLWTSCGNSGVTQKAHIGFPWDTFYPERNLGDFIF